MARPNLTHWVDHPLVAASIGSRLVELFYASLVKKGVKGDWWLTNLKPARNTYNVIMALNKVNPEGKNYFDIIEKLTVAFVTECVEGRVPAKEIKQTVKMALYSPEMLNTRYRVFNIPKKSGGFRTIEAPDETLKTIQRGLLYKWWYSMGGLRQCVQGFVPGRGILTNAERHFNPALARNTVLMKMDLRDFFPSITGVSLYDRIARLVDYRAHDVRNNYFKVPPALIAAIKKTEYSKLIEDLELPENGVIRPDKVSTHEIEGLMLLTAFGVVALCSLDGRLAQGSPCSPAASNIYMDTFHTSILSAVAAINADARTEEEKVIYSIYADDAIFSSGSMENILKVKGIAQSIIRRYPDISQNIAKTGIFRCGQSQKVTGVSITDRISISRQMRDKVRAELHNALVGKKKLDDKDIMRLKGLRAHIIGIDPDGWNKRCDKLFKAVIK